MPKWLIIAIVLIFNHILWIFFARVMKCIAEKDEDYWDSAFPSESFGAFFFPLFVFIFSAAKFVSGKAIYSGKFDDNEK